MTVSFSEIEGQPVAGSLLRARFQQAGPLVNYDLTVCREGIEHRVATVEQDGALGDWPLNPPLQSWQLAEDGRGHPLLLATGLAGRSHWSLALSVSETGGLLFDVACRVTGEPAFLGSTYRLESEIRGEADVTGGAGAMILPTARVGFQAICGSNYGTRASWDADRRTLQFCPTGAFRGGPVTLRWAYELKLEPT